MVYQVVSKGAAAKQNFAVEPRVVVVTNQACYVMERLEDMVKRGAPSLASGTAVKQYVHIVCTEYVLFTR